MAYISCWTLFQTSVSRDKYRKNSLLKCFGLQKISIIGYALLFPVEWHIFLVGNSFTLVLAGINIENKHGPESSIKYLVMNVYLMI